MKTSRNQPCPCGSGKKYKKCCLSQDQKATVEQNQQDHSNKPADDLSYIDQNTAPMIDEEYLEYCDALEELTNQANDYTRNKEWKEAETCCKRLLKEFPNDIDGHHRTYEYHKAREEYHQAKEHAQALLAMVQECEGFDPSFPARLQKDIETFTRHIQTSDQSK